MTWTDRLVGARMAVDGEFNDRIAQSSLSAQEWNLVMTATEFRIEDADDPERARLVGDTSKLPSVVPEMDRIASEQPGMGAPAGGASGGGGSGGGGIIDSLKSALGVGGSGNGGDDDERIAAAEELVAEYTDRLQERLESRGRWEAVRTAAADEEGETN